MPVKPQYVAGAQPVEVGEAFAIIPVIGAAVDGWISPSSYQRGLAGADEGQIGSAARLLLRAPFRSGRAGWRMKKHWPASVQRACIWPA